MKIAIFFVFCALSMSAFSQAGQQVRDEREIRKIFKIAKEMASLDLSCRSSEDCRVLPLGKRACGGPSDHIITSVNNTLLGALTEVAKQSKVKEDEYNRKYGIASICSIEMAPEPACVDNTCL